MLLKGSLFGGLPEASCSQPCTHARAMGLLVTCAGHSWPPSPHRATPAPPRQSCPAWGRRMLWPCTGPGFCLPGTRRGAEPHTPPHPTPRDPWGAPLLGCVPRGHGLPGRAAITLPLGPSASCPRSQRPEVAMTGSVGQALGQALGEGRGWPCGPRDIHARTEGGRPGPGKRPPSRRTVRSRATKRPGLVTRVSPSTPWCLSDPVREMRVLAGPTSSSCGEEGSRRQGRVEWGGGPQHRWGGLRGGPNPDGSHSTDGPPDWRPDPV